MKWTVFLDLSPTVNDFPHGYFPRHFRYKKDAEGLVLEVKKKGGEAHIERRDRGANAS